MKDANVKKIIKAVKSSYDILNCREITTIVYVYLENMGCYGEYFPLEIYINTAATYLKLDGKRVSAKKMQSILDKGEK